MTWNKATKTFFTSVLNYKTYVLLFSRYDNTILAGNEIYRLINENFRLLHNLPLYSVYGEEEEVDEEGLQEEDDFLDQDIDVPAPASPTQEPEDQAAIVRASSRVMELLGNLIAPQY